MKLKLLPALGVALGVFGSAGGNASVAIAEDDVANLIRRSAEANSALVRGDIDGYLALIDHARDYTLMAPFGGAPTRGFDNSNEHRKAMARFFKSGTLQQEVVATYGSGDLVVLVTIERVRAEVGGLPERTDPCVSHRFIVAKGPNGGSFIGMLIRWQTALPWNRQPPSLELTDADCVHRSQGIRTRRK